MRLTLPLPLLRILLASLLVPVSLSFSASAGTITDKTLTQADADNQVRYNTEKLTYTSPGTGYRFVLGDGPMNMTVSESITYSGYTYDYPGQMKAANDGWTSSGVIVADSVKGNVIQGYAGGWDDYSDRNTIKGDADRSYDLVFSGNAAERTTPVTRYPSSLSAGGGAVYLTNAGMSDLNLLSFVNNTLDNQLPSITQGYTTYYSQAEGGALWISKGIVSNINEIRFEGNTASSMARTNGGAAFMDGETLMENIGSLTFENNRATSPEWTMGGALYLQGTATIQNTESVSFINNVSEMNKESGEAYGGGLASNEGGMKFYFKSVGRLLFSGNTVTQAAALDSGWKGLGRLWGGAVFHSGQFYVQDSGEVEFTNNSADGTAHAVGSASVQGGAICSTGAVVFKGNNSILFENNRALRHPDAIRDNMPDVTASSSVGAFGGAVQAPLMQFINNYGDVVFRNNYATDRGGALYIDVPVSGAGSTSWLSADDGDITFRGNTHQLASSNERNSGVANAVWLEPSWNIVTGKPAILHIRATEGHCVNFYDPVCSAIDGSPRDKYHTENSYERATISLGTYFSFDEEGGMVEKYTGIIRFSGEFVRDTLAGSEGMANYAERLAESKKSILHATVNQYSGTLLLEHGVTFGTRGTGDLDDENNKTGTVFLQYRGILDISGSAEHGETTLAGRNIEFAGTGHPGQQEDTANNRPFVPADPDAVMSILRPGDMVHFDADRIDMSSGMTIDFAHHMTTTGFADISAIRVTADRFVLGGTLGIQDNAVDSNYYYADNRWAQTHSFSLFLDENGTHEGDFDAVKSLATGSDRVDSPYAYTGSWSHQWVDADGDGFPEQLQLVWTPDEEAAIRDILPELAGTLAMNSMWSSAANALGMSRAALGHLDALRFIAGPENNYWGKGMGDFLNHASEGTRDGFDYHGGGYSVGADRKITSHTVLGLGFGDLYGKMNGRSYMGDIDQQTRIGMLYGGWHKVLNRKNTLLVTGTAGYGWTDNKMNSFHTGGWSHGKWTNETLFGTLTGKWSRRVNETVAMEVMLGLEYTDVTQEAFTETGWDTRRFEKGHMKNMSVPVGVGLTHRSELKGREWINSAMVSYVPDVYRENPGAQAERLLNGYRWEAQGTSPDRNGVRVNVNSALQLNARWRTYAGYEFEGRSKATAHRFNAGVSYAY